MTVAALYIDPKGPYPKMASPPGLGVEAWDESRDARKYDGPHPVVAHPPCKHWGRLAHLATWDCQRCQWAWRSTKAMSGLCPDCGGPLVAFGRDCAPRAVEQVRKSGGVLEHPAGSKLWEACGLPLPVTDWKKYHRPQPCPYLMHGGCAAEGHWHTTPDPCDEFGYTIEVDQCEWGHVARKRTWLYLVGVPHEALEEPPFPGREPTHYASGGRTKSSRNGGAVPPGIKVCSEIQRRRTPPLFAEYLVRLARAAGEARAKGAA